MSNSRQPVKSRRRSSVVVALSTVAFMGAGFAPLGHELCAFAAAAAQVDEAKPPGADAAPAPFTAAGLEDAKRVIRELLGDGALELSTGPDSAADRSPSRTTVTLKVLGSPVAGSFTRVSNRQ
jgi:hypothetical protein